MQNQRRIRRFETGQPRPRRRKTPVIADDGAHVALVLLDVSLPATKGAHFTHGGRTWEIRGARHGSRVLVAAPLKTARQ